MKEDIRRRRQARIRQLTSGAAQPERASVQHEQRGEALPSLDENPVINSSNLAASPSELALSIDDRDPEEVWHASRKQWSSQYGWKDSTDDGRRRKPLLYTLRLQLIGAVVLVVIVSAMLRFPVAWTEKANAWLAVSLDQNMDMSTIASWYEETFGGSPAFIPIWNQTAGETKAVQGSLQLVTPIDGELLQPFTIAGKGIEFIPRKEDAQVYSAAMGRVTDVVRNADTGVTITIQHKNGYMTVYGKLASAEVRIDDWIEAGTVIGTMSADHASGDLSTMYFAVLQDGEYVNPMEVIDLD